MRIRFARAALASSTIAIGAVLLAGTVPAFANQEAGFYIKTPSGSRYWLVDDLGRATVSQPIEGGDTFENINGAKWGSRPVYEWWDLAGSSDVKQCLTSEGSSGQQVQIALCKAGDKNQLWWRTSGGQFINEGATGKGSSKCLNASHASDGSAVDVVGCKTKSQSGGFDQYWISLGT
jgi:Ricin-type beta-trefoil lectin domain